MKRFFLPPRSPTTTPRTKRHEAHFQSFLLGIFINDLLFSFSLWSSARKLLAYHWRFDTDNHYLYSTVLLLSYSTLHLPDQALAFCPSFRLDRFWPLVLPCASTLVDGWESFWIFYQRPFCRCRWPLGFCLVLLLWVQLILRLDLRQWR